MSIFLRAVIATLLTTSAVVIGATAMHDQTTRHWTAAALAASLAAYATVGACTAIAAAVWARVTMAVYARPVRAARVPLDTTAGIDDGLPPLDPAVVAADRLAAYTWATPTHPRHAAPDDDTVELTEQLATTVPMPTIGGAR